MLRAAREEAGLSREVASFRIHVGSRTLGSYERGETLAPPDVVLEMAKVYNRPEMPAAYCSNLCPIGQKFAHRCERDDLATTVLGVIKELGDVDSVKMDLIAVAADGIIGAEEMGKYKTIMVQLWNWRKRSMRRNFRLLNPELI